MSFAYNPDEMIEGGGRAEAGKYRYKIDDIQEVTFRSGNPGWKVILLVAAFDDRDIKVFDNIVNTPGALWRLKQLCDACGKDFNNPPVGGWDPYDFVNKTGTADFEVADNGYLKVKEYCAASANTGPNTRQTARPNTRQENHDYGPPAWDANNPPPPTDDDVPF